MMDSKWHCLQAQQRSRARSQPQSPPKPALSPSINPAIQAKLQQAHNRLLGSTRGGAKAEDGSARPAADKPGSRSGHKAAHAGKPSSPQHHLAPGIHFMACIKDTADCFKQCQTRPQAVLTPMHAITLKPIALMGSDYYDLVCTS